MGTFSGTIAKLYVDGIEVSSGTLPAASMAAYIVSIGTHYVVTNTTGGRSGLIDEPIIYNRTLSS